MHKTRRVVRTCENKIRLHAGSPGNRLIHSRRKNTLSARHARYRARNELTPRPSYPDGLPIPLRVCPKVFCTKRYVRKQTKNDNYTYSKQGSPSACVKREVPGVTQTERGHAGNTGVVTANVEGNMEHELLYDCSKKLVPGSSQQELLPSCYVLLFIYFDHYCIILVVHQSC